VYRADERGYTGRTFAEWCRRLNQRGEAEGHSVWLVAWETDEVAGTALGELIENVGWLHHLGVRRPWRRRGLGTTLTLSILASFHQQGIRTIHLNVDAGSLTNAQVLYRRLGFRVQGSYSNLEKIIEITER
jgi:mycothiol synthase